MKWLVSFGILLLISCHRPANKLVSTTTGTQITQIPATLIPPLINKKSAYIDTDSVNEVKVLNRILAYSLKQKSKTFFSKKLVSKADTSLYTKIIFGHIFSSQKKHLIIIQKSNYYTYINVFVLDNGNFGSVIKISAGWQNYVNFFIKDINGDRFKDFVYQWFPNAGCCLRNIYDVYLYQQATGKFSKSYKFANPTFSPSEKIVRGVDYGHPGEVPLYKYKWRGNNIDTIEYIYPADTLRKNFYRVHYYIHGPSQAKQVLTSVPKEYHNIMGYDWFMDY